MTFLVPREASLPFRNREPGSRVPAGAEALGRGEVWGSLEGRERFCKVLGGQLCSPVGRVRLETDTSRPRCSQDSKTGPETLTWHRMPAPEGVSTQGPLQADQPCGSEPCPSLWMGLVAGQETPPVPWSLTAPRGHLQSLPGPPQAWSSHRPGARGIGSWEQREGAGATSQDWEQLRSGAMPQFPPAR